MIMQTILSYKKSDLTLKILVLRIWHQGIIYLPFGLIHLPLSFIHLMDLHPKLPTLIPVEVLAKILVLLLQCLQALL